jgi:hypothetical protein
LGLKRKLNSIIEDLGSVVARFAELSQIEADENQSKIPTKQKIVNNATIDEHFEYLGRDFAYTSPVAFLLKGDLYRPIRSKWSQLYLLLMQVLRDQDSSVFSNLPNAARFRTNKGSKMFSASETDLRKGVELAEGVWAETNLSANQIAGNISSLLDEYGMDRKEFKVRLIQPRARLTLADLGLK